ncbi:MAG TPA: tetratricopeptide repeat protein [Candidatus Baltobacteraceae bacterium]|nr:tetratricopeptide repeat protein [Candidatus Baltobacteraceae bacterium]
MRPPPRSAVAAVALILGFASTAGAAAAAGSPPGAVPVTAPAPSNPPVDYTGPPESGEAAAMDAARAKVADGDTMGGIAVLAPYVAAHPRAIAAGRLLGDLYFRVPDYKRAEQIWRGVLAVVPSDRETHSRLGSLYAVEDQIDAAIAEFQKSLPVESGFTGLVMMHKKAGDLPVYLRTLQQRTEEEPLDVMAWQSLGEVQRYLHRYDLALAAYQHLVWIKPAACEPRVDIANVMVDIGKVDDAIAQLKVCLANDSGYYPAAVNIGEAYLEKRDFKTARPLLDRALALKPDGSEALVDIGYIYDAEGDWKTAIGWYDRALRSDPLRPEAYIDLGYDYSQHRLFPLAESAFLKGISVASDDGRLHYELAVTYNVQGKIALARREYELAIASQEPLVVHAARAELALLPPAG